MILKSAFFPVLVTLYTLQHPVAIYLLNRLLRRGLKDEREIADKTFTTEDETKLEGISVLIPIKGPEPHILENLISIVHQDWSGPLELVLAFQENDDPDRACVEILREKIRIEGMESRIQIRELNDLRLRGLNPKNSNLAFAAERASFSWLYCSDADTKLHPSHLRYAYNLARNAEAKGRLSFITSVAVHEGPKSLGAWLEVIGTNMEFANYFLLSHLSKENGALNGGSMFFHRDLLKSVGGFTPFLNKITDDLALRKAFVDVGAQPILLPLLTRVKQEQQSLKGFFERQLRWQLIVRCFDPFTFFALAPLNWLGQWLLLIGFLFSSNSLLAFGGFVLATRLLRSLIFQVMLGTPKSDWLKSIILPVYDLVSPFIWLNAAIATHVRWAGRKLDVERDGTVRFNRDRSRQTSFSNTRATS